MNYTYNTQYHPLNVVPQLNQGNEMNPFKRNILFCAFAAAFCYMTDEAGGGAAPETLLDLDSIEGMDFAGIEEAPGFVNPPNGVYLLKLSKAALETYTTKASDNKPSETKKRFAHYYDIMEVRELEDAKEQAPTIGSKFSERFMLNEKGLSYWKSKAKDILGDLGAGVTVSNVIAELNTGVYSFVAKIQNKKSKGADGKDYTNVNVRVIKAPAGAGAAATTQLP